MAKKSKTQRAKASANRQAKKAQKAQQKNIKATDQKVEEAPKKGFRKQKAEQPKKEKTAAELRQERRDAKMAAKENKAKKKHGKFVQFFIDVRSEMHRVTWPEKKDVAQWTGVVIGALVFFGVYIYILDNWIMTPMLVAISQLNVAG